MDAKSENLGRMRIILEITAWLTLMVLGRLALTLDLLPIREASVLCVILMSGLMIAAWYNFEGGRHPCFLFLVMLFVFQCGRLLGYFTGYPQDPLNIEVQVLIPYGVSRLSEGITLVLIAASAVCVYIPCRLSYRRVVFSAGPEQAWLRPLYILLAVTLPFSVYKSYTYLSYIRSHGGYMSIFTDSQAVLQSAGTPVRIVALVGTSVLLLLYLFERRRRYLALLLALFFFVSIMDLLIGLRGKFFVQILVFWFIWNLKTGKRFNLTPLFSSVAVISVLAVLVAGFRENRAVNLIGPIGFVSQQGVSINATEVAVEKRVLFDKHIGRYILGELRGAFVPNSDGFDSDLSLYLNPAAYSRGYGTASSYLADEYFIGGISGVVIASLIIGVVLSWLHNHSGSWMGAVLLLASLGSIVYMPRFGLFSPFSDTAKSLLGMGVAYVVIVLTTSGFDFLLHRGFVNEK